MHTHHNTTRARVTCSNKKKEVVGERAGTRKEVPLLCGCLTSHKPFASCHQAKKEAQRKSEGHSKRKAGLVVRRVK